MLRIIGLLSFAPLYLQVFAQPLLSDNSFEWVLYPECKPADTTHLIYAKAEIDPEFFGVDTIFFDYLLVRMTDVLGFTKGQAGLIKIKLLFSPDTPVCVREIGTNGLSLNAYQADIIRMHMERAQEFRPGTMNGIPQSCIGLVTIQVSEHGLEQYRLANFGF